jgi:hypothetical protein
MKISSLKVFEKEIMLELINWLIDCKIANIWCTFRRTTSVINIKILLLYKKFIGSFIQVFENLEKKCSLFFHCRFVEKITE